MRQSLPPSHKAIRIQSRRSAPAGALAAAYCRFPESARSKGQQIGQSQEQRRQHQLFGRLVFHASTSCCLFEKVSFKAYNLKSTPGQAFLKKMDESLPSPALAWRKRIAVFENTGGRRRKSRQKSVRPGAPHLFCPSRLKDKNRLPQTHSEKRGNPADSPADV